MPVNNIYIAQAIMRSIMFRGPDYAAVKTTDRRRIAAGVAKRRGRENHSQPLIPVSPPPLVKEKGAVHVNGEPAQRN